MDYIYIVYGLSKWILGWILTWPQPRLGRVNPGPDRAKSARVHVELSRPKPKSSQVGPSQTRVELA